MTEKRSGVRKAAKPAVGIVGLIATMASVWWFALRPRMKGKQDN